MFYDKWLYLPPCGSAAWFHSNLSITYWVTCVILIFDLKLQNVIKTPTRIIFYIYAIIICIYVKLRLQNRLTYLFQYIWSITSNTMGYIDIFLVHPWRSSPVWYVHLQSHIHKESFLTNIYYYSLLVVLQIYM